ncbi:hypothetical protein NKR19_g9475 [Coniochaeta hoffmannii]|uniref:HIT domain-containing protein n=1 Tax=Coniochaeta hoffmannii TaxID=91930 RepID=A0AA38R194_9PEZI|nr:hypothetical protein NKR19_g9475 [Coniochaeta hoffmannii]
MRNGLQTAVRLAETEALEDVETVPVTDKHLRAVAKMSEIPCFKLFESEKTLPFLDINPLSRGHALVIPKFHGEKLTDIPAKDSIATRNSHI